MVYVFDLLTNKSVYINPLNVAYATLHNNDVRYYDVYSNDNSKITVTKDQFLRIKKAVNQCLQ